MLWSSVPVAAMIMGLLYLRMALHKVRVLPLPPRSQRDADLQHTPLPPFAATPFTPQIPLATEIFSVLLPLGACGQGAFAILQLADVGIGLTKLTGFWLDGGRMLGGLPAEMSEVVAGSVWAGTVWCVSRCARPFT